MKKILTLLFITTALTHIKGEDDLKTYHSSQVASDMNVVGIFFQPDQPEPYLMPTMFPGKYIYSTLNYKWDGEIIINRRTYTNIKFSRIESVNGTLIAIMFHSKGILRVSMIHLSDEVYEKLQIVCKKLPKKNLLIQHYEEVKKDRVQRQMFRYEQERKEQHQKHSDAINKIRNYTLEITQIINDKLILAIEKKRGGSILAVEMNSVKGLIDGQSIEIRGQKIGTYRYESVIGSVKTVKKLKEVN